MGGRTAPPRGAPALTFRGQAFSRRKLRALERASHAAPNELTTRELTAAVRMAFIVQFLGPHVVDVPVDVLKETHDEDDA